MKNFNKAFRKFIAEKIYFAGTEYPIHLVWLPEDQKFTTTIFFNEHTIINLMKAEIII
jgi:hypothetical protein